MGVANIKPLKSPGTKIYGRYEGDKDDEAVDDESERAKLIDIAKKKGCRNVGETKDGCGKEVAS